MAKYKVNFDKIGYRMSRGERRAFKRMIDKEGEVTVNRKIERHFKTKAAKENSEQFNNEPK